jgi:thymidylate synthase
MIALKGQGISELYPTLLELALEEGETVAPRGLPTLEVSPLLFELADPRQCLVLQKARRLNYAYAIVERLSLLSGHSDPDMLCFYVGKLRDYVNPCTGCFDGAYGPRVRPQLEYVYDELRRDPASRRAVISVYSPSDQRDSLDVPCTLTLHFLIRRGRLDLIVNMRSSDLFLGLPYDVNQFGFLQQVVAAWLDVGLGTYTHFASSAHVYSEHADKATQVAVSGSDVIERAAVAPRIAFRETFTQAELWFDLERRARTERLSPEVIAGLPETRRLAPELRGALFEVAAFSTRKLATARAEPATAGRGIQA